MSSLFQNVKQKKNHKIWGYLFLTYKYTQPYNNYDFFKTLTCDKVGKKLKNPTKNKLKAWQKLKITTYLPKHKETCLGKHIQNF